MAHTATMLCHSHSKVQTRLHRIGSSTLVITEPRPLPPKHVHSTIRFRVKAMHGDRDKNCGSCWKSQKKKRFTRKVDEDDGVDERGRRHFVLASLTLGSAMLSMQSASAASSAANANVNTTTTTNTKDSDPTKNNSAGSSTVPLPPSSRIYDATAIGEPMAIGKERDRFWNRLLASKIIYLGEPEYVPDPDDKVIELEILQTLRNKTAPQQIPLSLAMQAIPVDIQPQIDKYLTNRITLDDLRPFLLHWTSQKWKEYLPIMHYCQENGIKLIACGAPLEIMQAVESSGMQGLTNEQRKKYFPPSGLGLTGSSIGTIRRPVGQNNLQQTTSSFVRASYLFAEARAVEDNIMSQIITKATLDGGSTGLLIVIAGAHHMLFGVRGCGVPARISKTITKRSQVVILLNLERQLIRKEGEAPVADYLWYSAAKPCNRNCFDRAEIARVMSAASRRRNSLPKDIQRGIDLGLVSPEILKDFLDLEEKPLIAELLNQFQGFRERWLANPKILQRLLLEEAICLSTTVLAQYKKRKEHFFKELDFVISDTFRSVVVSFFAVWLPAPTLSFTSFDGSTDIFQKRGGIDSILHPLPENAFQMNSSGKYWDIRARLISVLAGGLKLFSVGFISNLGTLSFSKTLFSMRRQLHKTVGDDNAIMQYPVLKSSFIYGCFLGVSGNLRYQFIAGIVENWIADYLLASQPLLGYMISFSARVFNSYFGTQQWIDLARYTGIQKGLSIQKKPFKQES